MLGFKGSLYTPLNPSSATTLDNYTVYGCGQEQASRVGTSAVSQALCAEGPYAWLNAPW